MRATIVRFVLVLVATLVAGGMFATPAGANSNDELTDNDQIVMNGRLIVAEGDTVDTAVLFHGSATIDGTVTKSVVVLDGPTEISVGPSKTTTDFVTVPSIVAEPWKSTAESTVSPSATISRPFITI